MASRIPLISNYCDRWCERCAFTARCSAYEVHLAIGMCGDVSEAMELAIGIPHPGPGEPPRPTPAWMAELPDDEPSPAELAAFVGQERARERRIRQHAISNLAEAVTMLTAGWFRARLDAVAATADDVLKEALEVAQHDAGFIGAKLYRALDGQARAREGEGGDDHPVQNDWNGSAKVALISIERSEAAWRTIAAATGEEAPREIAGALGALREDVERAFPDAWKFVRPGFDETVR